jgi:L-ascorbate metabolism protein UlaG (beta-lactamase superfamily)
MRVEWFGQSAFHLTGGGRSVFIDPFGDLSAATAGRGMRFDYPAIGGVSADLVLITHEHVDHNAAEVIDGQPPVLRSTAGRLDSPIGEVVAVASEHDTAAGTERGPNTIFVFSLDGIRIAHLGDLGQGALRPEQLLAIGPVDLIFLPVGGGPTLDAAAAAAAVAALDPRWVVPMHYRTPRISFLETADAFIELMPRVHELASTAFETSELPGEGTRLAVVPAVP